MQVVAGFRRRSPARDLAHFFSGCRSRGGRAAGWAAART